MGGVRCAVDTSNRGISVERCVGGIRLKDIEEERILRCDAFWKKITKRVELLCVYYSYSPQR